MAYHRLLLLVLCSLIFAMGLVMIFSTSSAEVLDHDLATSTRYALIRQLIYGVAGIGVAFMIWKVGYLRFLQISPLLLRICIVLLILTLIPGIGKEVNGSRRWLGIAGFSFQPSEFVKYCVPAFFIHRILQLRGRQPSFREFLHLVAIATVPIILILIEPNNGTAAVISLTLVTLCLLTRIPCKFWALPLAFFLIAGALFASQLPYVTARLKVYLHPELDLKGKGHQPYQAKIAAGSGQLLGKGPGNSLQKLSYLPEAQNDYIAAIYAEEFGFSGILMLILLYMGIAYAGFSIAYHASERAGLYYAATVTFLICFQAFLNLGVVSGLLPSTGLNLPLFSQGGTSLIANVMGVGILFNISECTERKK